MSRPPNPNRKPQHPGKKHLKRLRELELEDQDRRGYLVHPQRSEEYRVWEDAASWPED